VTEPLTMYNVYHRPTDVPGAEYVLREVKVYGGDIGQVFGPILGTAATLPGIRLLLPLTADACLTRSPEDPPHIVETWL